MRIKLCPIASPPKKVVPPYSEEYALSVRRVKIWDVAKVRGRNCYWMQVDGHIHDVYQELSKQLPEGWTVQHFWTHPNEETYHEVYVSPPEDGAEGSVAVPVLYKHSDMARDWPALLVDWLRSLRDEYGLTRVLLNPVRRNQAGEVQYASPLDGGWRTWTTS